MENRLANGLVIFLIMPNIKIVLLFAEIVQVYVYRNHYTCIIVIIQITNRSNLSYVLTGVVL